MGATVIKGGRGGGGGGGITNSAGADVIMKSDGTNAVASQLSEAGSTVSTNGAFSVGTVGTPDPGGGNPDGRPFYTSAAGHTQLNKLDVTSTGGGCIEAWGGIRCNDNLSFGNRNDFDQEVIYGRFGYADGDTRWRSHHFYDGKGFPIIEFDGALKQTTFRGPQVHARTATDVAADVTMSQHTDNGTYDTTGAARNLIAHVIQLSATRSAGSNSLLQTGLYVDVYGAQSNEAIRTVRGSCFFGVDYQSAYHYINTSDLSCSGAVRSQGNLTVGASAFGGTATFQVEASTGKVTVSTGATAWTITTSGASPEGVVSAAIGSLHIRTGSGGGLYVKESNSGGDTGWQVK